MLVPPEDILDAQDNLQTDAHPPTVPNSNLEAATARTDSVESSGILPSLMTQQDGDQTSMIWLNGEFRTRPWLGITKAIEGPTSSIECEGSDLEPDLSDSGEEGT